MQIGNVQIFILYCTGHCTLPHRFKTALGYPFLRKSWCPVARYHQKKLFSRHCFCLNSITSHLRLFFMTKAFSIKNNASTCCTELTAVGYHDRGHLLSAFKTVQNITEISWSKYCKYCNCSKILKRSHLFNLSPSERTREC